MDPAHVQGGCGQGSGLSDRLNILITEGEDRLRMVLADHLGRQGYGCAQAARLASMRELLASHAFDLIVLDLMMPGEDSLAALRDLQQVGAPPVIALSAGGADVDGIIALEIGAEDFMQKPLNPRELVARIRTVLRRCERQGPSARVRRFLDAERELYRFAGWILDATTRTLFDPNGLIVSLSDGEFRMLHTFVQRPHRVLSRNQLLDFALGVNREHFDRAVDVQISRLRRKLSGRVGSLELIRTVRNEGYIFTPEVTR
ncbi:response regulator [Sphingomonas carotinifaciens]|uniref:Regulatory protein VirG n=3 Tax=Sphingomonas carotinifaciens TaxID=1166323 RepID=A0A6N8LXI4_9SPHN|nr:response regulator [Sphingomonas carotinifaciens]